MKKLKVELKQESYEVIIDYNLIDDLENQIRTVYNNEQVFVLIDQNVNRIYANKILASLKGFAVQVIEIEPTEASKTLKVYVDVVKDLLSKNITRDCLILSIGGGVVLDLASFVASTLYRGINYISVPTTVLAQADVCLGGKTAVNFQGQKNVLGTFYQPKLVIVDPTFLQTLDKNEFRSGLAEIIKHAVLGSDKLCSMLETSLTVTGDMIYESLLVKKRYVEKDILDKAGRMILNFGHTFGHIVESEKKVRHGIAIGLGMLMATRLGMDLGITKPVVYEKIRTLLQIHGLDASYIDHKPYMSKIGADKKNLAGSLNVIFLRDLGKPIIHKLQTGFGK